MSSFKSKNSEENYSTYFPYFNHTLFMSQEEFSKEDDSEIEKIETPLSDESSTSISQESVNSLEEEEKLIPVNLLDLSPVEDSLESDFNFDINPKDLFNTSGKEEKKQSEKIKPELQKFILPKELFKTNKTKKSNNPVDLDEKMLKAKPFIPTKYKMQNTFLVNFPADFFNSQNDQFNKFNSYIQYELTIKRTKKKFVERKGDWRCSKCNNINFSFRNQCNKCKISKEDSQKFLIEFNDKMVEIDNTYINNKI
jgi:hypothetical protein